MCFAAVVPNSLCSFMSQPTKMLTTSPTLAQLWHWTREQQIEHFSCEWCGSQLRFSHWARDEDKGKCVIRFDFGWCSYQGLFISLSEMYLLHTEHHTATGFYLSPKEEQDHLQRSLIVHADITRSRVWQENTLGGIFCRGRRIPCLPLSESLLFWISITGKKGIERNESS